MSNIRKNQFIKKLNREWFITTAFYFNLYYEPIRLGCECAPLIFFPSYLSSPTNNLVLWNFSQRSLFFLLPLNPHEGFSLSFIFSQTFSFCGICRRKLKYRKPITKLLLDNLGIIKMSAGQEVYVNFRLLICPLNYHFLVSFSPFNKNCINRPFIFIAFCLSWHSYTGRLIMRI